MTKKAYASLACYFLAIATFVGDQWVKLWVVDHMGLYQSIPMLGSPAGLGLNFTYVRNIGAAFSAFSGQVWGLALVAGAVAIAIIAYMQRLKEPTLGHVLALGLLLGGTLGNFHDRILYKYVVDMFDAQWHGHNFFPIWNIADMAIDGGVAILLLVFFFEGRAAKRELPNGTGDVHPRST